MPVTAHYMFEVEMEPCPLDSGFDCPHHLMYYRGEVKIPEFMPQEAWSIYALHVAERDLGMPLYHKLTIIIMKS